MVRLGDVCEIKLGKTPPRGVCNCWDNEKLSSNVWVSIADMANTVDGKIQDSKEYITDYAIETSGIPVVKEGTLLLSFKLTLGRTAIAGRNLYTNEAIAALPIKPEFSSCIDLTYLTTYFSFFDWVGFASKDEKLLGKTLNKKKLAEVPISLPPLSVQREIVARLEKELGEADRLAAKFKRVAELADDAFKAELDETFKTVEGDKVRLGDVCEKIIDCPHTTAPDEGEGFPLVRTPNVGLGRLVYANMHRVSEVVYKERVKRGVPQSGDLIFAREAPAGNVAVIQSGEKVCLGQRTVLLKPREKINSDWLAYYILSPASQERLLTIASGSTVTHVNVCDIKRFEITLIPITDQRAIVAKLDAAKNRCEKLKAAALRGLAAAENMRKAILSEAFGQTERKGNEKD